jgi:opacity protein-like surface antigen
MKRFFLAAILLAGCQQCVFAQTADVAVTKEKKVDHFVGLQMNGLIRQVFNFNGGSQAVENPYLITYNINSHKSGWGLRTGLGYNYKSGANNDGITETKFKINTLNARLGIEKAFRLSDKWSAGVGLDGLANSDDDNTTNIVRSFDTTTTVTKSVISSYGGGAMGWLRYNITEKILIGTEASFYYTTGTQSQTIILTRRVRNGPSFFETTTETKSKPTISEAVLNLPLVFYLTVKF